MPGARGFGVLTVAVLAVVAFALPEPSAFSALLSVTAWAGRDGSTEVEEDMAAGESLLSAIETTASSELRCSQLSMFAFGASQTQPSWLSKMAAKECLGNLLLQLNESELTVSPIEHF
jgi:hypothetical protein